MCGISGEVRFDGTLADTAAVAAMTRTLAPRGPDGAGLFSRGPFALGHRRLAIIDLSTRGSQPMVDPELGLALVFNGCIYNYEELREQLRAASYRFFSDADSEVVIKAYHHWGAGCFERFRGMFAVGIIELDSGVSVLARDRLGIKPLYLSQGPGRVRFASSVQALLAAGEVDTSIDRVALHHYLSFHSVVPPPHTILTGVRKLPPATVRVYQPDGTFADQVYWRPTFARDPQRSDWSVRDWQEALLETLRGAVRRRMVADVPVGVLLSGGFDSSVIVGLLAQEGQRDLATFSIGFDAAGGESGDEYVDSDLVAREFGTDHHRLHVDTAALVPAVLPTVAAMTEPMISHDCVAFYLLSQTVSQHVKVVQSGQGADEVLAGYSWYPPLAAVDPQTVTEHYAREFFDRTHDGIAALVNPEYALSNDPSYAFVAEHQRATLAAAKGQAREALDAALSLDTQIMLVDDPVKRVDAMTMAWGLEGRVPFLDHDFVELAAACPPALKLAGGGKGVLKEAARGLVPDAVIDRTKGYFPVPGIRHLEGELLHLVRDALSEPAARDRAIFRPEATAALLAEPNATRTTLDGNALWQVALLELWLQSLPTPGTPAGTSAVTSTATAADLSAAEAPNTFEAPP
ncbi:asparagine synthase (glutamine-hydrolyzing) [Kineosphaera limosa]|uniref:asparagine synthase (glutamine-hydrolyzing) n=1 Tax=Kineosphaera limosa NBRC 100340 TaxID=1184609 RepID=K6VLC8_9MICO|nr:N-acetylglutaminylglutamine amidotransferase [Kineosphaera limosa]NYE00390.1 asparagine synthase (glutamine-hydrolyzing) [Kineosphaera limosa]GAB97028.1 putative asparagine synthetase [Kineosphaera limosa NBRC 100340]